MCLTLYVASDNLLPGTDTPELFIRPLEGRERRVLKHFTKPEAVFVGAYTGCACGFQPPERQDAELRASSIRELLKFLDTCAPGQSLELFVSWSGRENKAAKHQLSFPRRELATRMDWCAEQTFIALAG